MTSLVFTLAFLVGAQAEAPLTFENRLHSLLLVYKRFATPVDRRPIYRSNDPAAVEGRRRAAAILFAAEHFDPKEFDRIEPGLAKRFRREFLGGLRRSTEVSKRNAKTLEEMREDTTDQVKAHTMYADFIRHLQVYHPELFPKGYDKPYTIPDVWRPSAGGNKTRAR